MITSLSLQNIAQACEGSLQGEDLLIEQVSTDTRKIAQGDLFVALRGENFDAHDFLASAVEQGAVALVVEHANKQLSVPQIVVADTSQALGHIGRLARQQFEGTLVAITGSSGKTTVKEMLASIFREAGEVHATKGNLNNHIGVPLTLLAMESSQDFAVIEMGASGLHEIGYLVSIGQPQIALVNNAMAAHLEGFGSLQGVANTKGEIYAGLQSGGTAVLNADDQFYAQWRDSLRDDVKPLSFSVSGKADFCAQHISQGENGAPAFTLVTPAGDIAIQLQLLGAQNIANALAAAACAYAAGVALPQIQMGLQNVQAVAGRLSAQTGVSQALIIDDSYNANPGSVRAAIDTLVNLQARDKTILVLGDLGELGEDADKLVKELGVYAKQAGVQQLITTGIISRFASAGFGEGSQHFEKQWDAIQQLQHQVDKNTVVLIKGSRSARMDVVVQALTQSGDNS
jgi:UDP-N-acetylmuramoyl-tripeptide--D-alanyl-D-alanine ligase